MNEDTLVATIHYSEEFLVYFKTRCEAHGMRPVPLALAKHRFDCLRKVLEMMCTHFKPFMDTAMYILASRPSSSKASVVARRFLLESDEVRIQIGMMADASTEVMLL